MVAPFSGLMLAIVARSGSASSATPGPKYSTNLSTTLWRRSACVTVRTTSVAVTPGLRPAGEPAADDLRHQHGDRLAERPGAAFEAADAPAENAEAVDHGRVAVHAEHRIRVGDRPRAAGGVGRAAARPHHPREALEIDLVADAVARRHDAQVVEGPLAPAQKARSARRCARTRAPGCGSPHRARRRRPPSPSDRRRGRRAPTG